MNDFIKQNLFKLGVLLIFVLITIVYFYWFQIRSTQIRKECIKKYPPAFYEGGGYISVLDKLNKSGYERCLREHGLEK